MNQVEPIQSKIVQITFSIDGTNLHSIINSSTHTSIAMCIFETEFQTSCTHWEWLHFYWLISFLIEYDGITLHGKCALEKWIHADHVVWSYKCYYSSDKFIISMNEITKVYY